MAYPVYSTRLFAGTVGATYSVLYTVPSGRVAILTDVDVVNFGSSETSLGFKLLPEDVLFVFLQALAPAAGRQWRGRQVLRTGDQLAASSPGSVQFAVSGYEFIVP